MSRQLSIKDCFSVGGGRAKESNKDTEAAQAKKRATDRTYDQSKRQRSFQTSWKIGRPWLEYDEGKGLLSCTLCKLNKYKLADQTSLYVTGAKCLQISSVIKHEKSVGHCREQEATDAATSKQQLRPAERMLLQFRSKQNHQLSLKFRTVHALARHHRPFKDFAWHNNLDKIKGLDVGTQYETDMAAATFAEHIAEVCKK